MLLLRTYLIICGIELIKVGMMKKGESSSSSIIRGDEKIERKDIERNRRIHMKNLCYQLLSLIPSNHFNPPKDFLSQQDQLEQAAYYIKKLRERIDQLRRRKSEANPDHHHQMHIVLKLRDLGSSLQVIFISGRAVITKNNNTPMLHQIIAILEQGGAEIVTLSISKIGHKIFHTLHAQAKVSRVGVDTSRIRERFEELIYINKTKAHVY